jgi:hypothetical protein
MVAVILLIGVWLGWGLRGLHERQRVGRVAWDVSHGRVYRFPPEGFSKGEG